MKKIQLFALSVLALVGCVNTPFEPTQPTPNYSEFCQINFSVLPHKKAIELLGNDRLSAVWQFRGSYEQERKFIESFDAIAQQVIQLYVPNADFEVETIFGGYRGFTSPSLSLRVELSEEVDRRDLHSISASLGYVFVQESVLLSCSPSMNQANLVPSISLTESGSADALNPGTLKKIYGMMIGEADGDLELGFSYYPTEDRFSVLGFVKGGDRERQILTSIKNYLTDLSGPSHSIKMEELSQKVSFSFNDWASAPFGELYVELLDNAELTPVLQDLQTQFVLEIDEFLAANSEAF